MTIGRTKNWQTVKLGDITKITMGQSPPSKFYNTSGEGLPFFQGVTDFSDKYPTVSTYCTDPRKVAHAGQILFSVRAPVGDLNIADQESCIGRGVSALSMKEGDDTFLYFLLKRYQKFFKSIAGGTTYESINKDQIEDSEVLIPTDVEEQSRIASILSVFDNKIELNNKINQTLEKTAQAIFKEWFGKHFDQMFSESKTKLSDFVSTQYGYTESASDKEVGPKFLRVMDINKADWISWSSVPYCPINEDKLEKYKLEQGDIVIARMADPGKVAMIEEEISAVFASYLIRLKIIDKRLTSYFLYYFMKSPWYQDFIFGASTGTTRRSANARVIVDCPFDIPAAKLQEFEDTIKLLRTKITLNNKESQTLASLRDILLPKLMSGEVRV